MEKAIFSGLLALHNLALVVCIAGPFYMARIVKARAKYEKKIIYQMDLLEEDVITTQPIICMVAIFVLYATGIGFPMVYLLFHGALRETSTVALTAFWVKQVLILGIVVIQFYGTFYLNPRLKELFSRFQDGVVPSLEDENAFFTTRAMRKKWCDRCLVLGILVLIVSPIVRWY